MSTAIRQHDFRFPKGPDEERRATGVRHNAPILVFDAGDTGDTVVPDIVSIWARHSAAANGFGD